MMCALSISALVSWGITYYTFSVVITPMQMELGWSTAELTGAFSLGLLSTGIADVFVGRWLDARGPRLLMVIGAIAASLLIWAWSEVESLPGFYATMIGLGVAGAAVQYAPAFWVAAQWFTHRRGLALTVLTIGGGFASTVFVPLTTLLVHQGGWRHALAVLAVVLAAITIPLHALLLRNRPTSSPPVRASPRTTLRASPHGANTREALRLPAFWLLAVVFGLTGFAFNGISVHLYSFALSRAQDPGFTAFAAGLAGAFQVVGRIGIVPLSDRLSARSLLNILLVVQATAFVALMVLTPDAGLLAHVILRGLSVGPMSPLRASILADVFGTTHYGSVSGALSSLLSVFVASAPFAIGLLVSTATYPIAIGVLTACCILAATTFAVFGRHLRNTRD